MYVDSMSIGAHCAEEVQWANELSHQILLKIVVQNFVENPLGKGSMSS